MELKQKNKPQRTNAIQSLVPQLKIPDGISLLRAFLFVLLNISIDLWKCCVLTDSDGVRGNLVRHHCYYCSILSEKGGILTLFARLKKYKDFSLRSHYN